VETGSLVCILAREKKPALTLIQSHETATVLKNPLPCFGDSLTGELQYGSATR
jgi:hypothetical protein